MTYSRSLAHKPAWIFLYKCLSSHRHPINRGRSEHSSPKPYLIGPGVPRKSVGVQRRPKRGTRPTDASQVTTVTNVGTHKTGPHQELPLMRSNIGSLPGRAHPSHRGHRPRPDPQGHPVKYGAHTLIELLITLSITLGLLILSLPLFRKSRHDLQFARFCSQIKNDLITAHRIAQATGLAVSIDFSPHQDHRYQIYYTNPNGTRRQVALSSYHTKYYAQIRCRLPEGQTLSHPTLDRPINRPLTGLQENRWIFTRSGAAGGTAIFSDEEGRTLCIVLYGAVGRFRMYQHDQKTQEWKILH